MYWSALNAEIVYGPVLRYRSGFLGSSVKLKPEFQNDEILASETLSSFWMAVIIAALALSLSFSPRAFFATTCAGSAVGKASSQSTSFGNASVNAPVSGFVNLEGSKLGVSSEREFAAQSSSMSEASTGVPSDHFTPSLMVYFTVSGSSDTFSYVPKAVSLTSLGVLS